MERRGSVRLNEMTSLFDLGLFPLAVCAGAVANVAFTIIVTRLGPPQRVADRFARMDCDRPGS